MLFLLVIFSISSCDDGELTLESFNFDNATIGKCPDSKELIFKTSNDELLLINLGETNYNFLFQPLETQGVPRTKTITSTENQVIYRKYTGNINSNTICSTVPVAFPTVAKEWNATGGTISVETNKIVNTNNETVGYTHNITFININFANSENSFSFTSYIYGNYEIMN